MWSTRVYEQAKQWMSYGAKVTVVTSPYYKSDIKASGFICKQNIDGIEVIVVNAADNNKHSTIRRALNALMFALVASYFAVKLRYNVLICSSGPITVGIPYWFARLKKNVFRVFEVRDLWPSGAIELGKISNNSVIKLSRWFERKCYASSDLVVACSKGMEAGVIDSFSKAKTLVIPNACDNHLFESVDAYKQSKPYFIYTGSLGFMDDLAYLMEGLNTLTKEELEKFDVLIFGDGAERDHLESLKSEYNLDNVHFRGIVPKTDVFPYLFGAQAAFVLFKNYPVLSTVSPNKMFDAFAASVPIIQNTTGWIAELVKDEACGINTSPEDATDIGQAILTMLGDVSKQRQMAENAKRLATESFDRHRLGELYYNQITS